LDVKEALEQTSAALRQAGLPETALESRLFVQRALGINQVTLYLNPQRQLNTPEADALRSMIERRLHGEPFFYIIGEREFYGLYFYVNHNVLIPRPETELLVDKAIGLSRTEHFDFIADIGAGSGNIAVCLAVHIPTATIYATDISNEALKVARFNCCKHGVVQRIKLLSGDLLHPLPKKCGCIIANLPYVKSADIKGSLKHEPIVALNGGEDGLEQIKRLLHMLKSKLNDGGYLLLEIGQGQAETLNGFTRELYPQASVEITDDSAGIARVMSIKTPVA
jgi:release factor glutamine methyltransferase